MIKIRLQKISDAERFYEILGNPHFTYFNVQPKSIKDERKWLAENPKRRKNNTEWNYTIMNDDEIIGAIGVKINLHRNHIGEIGYFLDEKFWGKGIATQAVKLVENICFKKLKLTRLEIVVQPKNEGSKKVAIKNKYLKEGLLKKVLKYKDGSMKDCFLYAKVL
ncbi:MAG: GNAT family N-acetyltransferase [Patescibacteria group bacterium]|jgi:ribosomal-protein-alanine N-acetyltransferase